MQFQSFNSMLQCLAHIVTSSFCLYLSYDPNFFGTKFVSKFQSTLLKTWPVFCHCYCFFSSAVSSVTPQMELVICLLTKYDQRLPESHTRASVLGWDSVTLSRQQAKYVMVCNGESRSLGYNWSHTQFTSVLSLAVMRFTLTTLPSVA